jgi:hypothetical protein
VMLLPDVDEQFSFLEKRIFQQCPRCLRSPKNLGISLFNAIQFSRADRTVHPVNLPCMSLFHRGDCNNLVCSNVMGCLMVSSFLACISLM